MLYIYTFFLHKTKHIILTLYNYNNAKIINIFTIIYEYNFFN